MKVTVPMSTPEEVFADIPPAANRFEFSASYDKGQTWRVIMTVDSRQMADQVLAIILRGEVGHFTAVRTAEGLIIKYGMNPRWRWRTLS